MDRPKRCLDCYYILDGLADARCPECGRTFDPANATTYTDKPPFIWSRFWLPGFLLATAVGTLTAMVLITAWGFTAAAAIVTPLVMGVVLGYACRVRTFFLAMLVFAAVVGVVFGLAGAGILGVFCGVVMGAVGILPAGLGALAGYALRTRLRDTAFSQRAWLPVLLVWLIPLVAGALEGRHHYPRETIRTAVVLPASVDKAWDNLCFYEEVRHEPPLLLRLLLPKPLYARGDKQHVGDVTTCVYTKGRLVKRVTRAEPGRLLAFDVIEQVKIETRSVRLTSGSFTFEPLGPDQTRVTLATEYEPLLGPRFAWAWAERWATHTLHAHVLRGMELRAAERPPLPPAIQARADARP